MVAAQFKKAFTLVELLVSVGIIVVLLSIFAPSLRSARDQARSAVCRSNLHQLGLAVQMYLADFNGQFWKYKITQPDGEYYWFGFEKDGPANTSTPYRPLDQTQSILSPYLGDSIDNRLECPKFPYQAGGFFPKFAESSATYGYNIELAQGRRIPDPDRLPYRWPFEKFGNEISQLTKRTIYYLGREDRVVVFADAVHFDLDGRFMEGHYLEYRHGAVQATGYAHFRHEGAANLLLMDGHVESQPLRGPEYTRFKAYYPAGNLSDSDGGHLIYGF